MRTRFPFLRSLALVLALPVLGTGVLAQQAVRGTVVRATVAVAPGVSGGTGAGPAGGISHVTRPTPQARGLQAGAAFFSAGGVPLVAPAPATGAGGGGGGGGGGVPAVSPSVASRTGRGPESAAIQSLSALAAGGDPRARQALGVLRSAPAASAVRTGR